ncbi:MAG: hypothetical protein Q8L98_01490 [Chlamydiales bacterium]|nr:hypothetical protein [Chlamydiales bacterium]
MSHINRIVDAKFSVVALQRPRESNWIFSALTAIAVLSIATLFTAVSCMQINKLHQIEVQNFGEALSFMNTLHSFLQLLQ